MQEVVGLGMHAQGLSLLAATHVHWHTPFFGKLNKKPIREDHFLSV